jgi:hypothetical protein
MQQIHDDGSVSLKVDVWLESDGSIRLALPGSSEPPLRIKNDAERPSGHPRLFRFLARYLKEQGAPAPRV